MKKEINVLGTEYKILLQDEKEEPCLTKCDGFCDTSIKTIVIKKIEKEVDSLKDLNYYNNNVLRHELIHAFLYESGLSVNSDWATNEEMVDFFAIQFLKILKMFNELGCI